MRWTWERSPRASTKLSDRGIRFAGLPAFASQFDFCRDLAARLLLIILLRIELRAGADEQRDSLTPARKSVLTPAALDNYSQEKVPIHVSALNPGWPVVKIRTLPRSLRIPEVRGTGKGVSWVQEFAFGSYAVIWAVGTL